MTSLRTISKTNHKPSFALGVPSLRVLAVDALGQSEPALRRKGTRPRVMIAGAGPPGILKGAHVEKITGELVAHRIIGSDFWSIATIKTDAGETVSATGKFLGVQIGDTLEATGTWTESPKYGKQFKVAETVVAIPQTDNGVIAWLSSGGRFSGIGPKRAREMLEEFGGAAELWSVIENTPAELAKIKGITEETAEKIADSYARFRYDRDRMIKFRSWGMTENQIARMLEAWGDEAERRLRDNPYELSDFVHGFGFLRADAIAQRMGVPSNSPARIRCGLVHTMAAANGSGHCYVSSGKLVKLAASKILRLPEPPVWEGLKLLKADGRFVAHGERIFERNLNAAERECADRIRVLLGLDS